MMLLYLIWNTIQYPEIKVWFFLLYQGNSSNLSGLFTKHYWHILTKALQSYIVAVAETPRWINCKPNETTNITQYATEPVHHTRWKFPEISNHVADEQHCTNYRFFFSPFQSWFSKAIFETNSKIRSCIYRVPWKLIKKRHKKYTRFLHKYLPWKRYLFVSFTLH